MPTFDFICETCGYILEQFVSMNYPKITECPQCHKNTFIRCIGIGSGIIFKGSGFYETDIKQANDYVKENDQMNKERNQRAKDDPEF